MSLGIVILHKLKLKLFLTVFFSLKQLSTTSASNLAFLQSFFYHLTTLVNVYLKLVIPQNKTQAA